VGTEWIGGGHPVLIQSMTVADTMDTAAAAAEVRELVAAGCPLVRLTTPSIREAENLRTIRERLAAEGVRVPMVADVHFTPNAALAAARIVEKVRVNPGNYADRKRFAVREYSDEEYAAELARVADRFRPLVAELRAHGCALRIGANHGSLSDRILNRYGDTPEGMVESALEFVRVCEEMDYREIVLSMKSSVPGVMIAAYRLLARRMDAEGMAYPLHLGVTEAGDGLEARIKSVIGIGALLVDGIGDTIRVSLAEDSRHEIAAARAILEAVARERGEGDTLPGPPAEAPDAPELPAPSPGRLHASGAPAGSTRPPVSPVPRRRPSRPWVLGALGLGGEFPVRVERRVLLHGGPLPAGVISGAGGSEENRAELLSVRVPRAAGAPPEEIAARLAALRRALPPGDAPPILFEGSIATPEEVRTLEAMLPQVDGLSLALDPAFDPQADAARETIRGIARSLRNARKPVRWRLPADRTGRRLDRLDRPDHAEHRPECPPAAVVAGALSALCHGEGLNTVGFLCEPGPRWVPRMRSVAGALAAAGDLLFLELPARGPSAALLAGAALLDGIGDALCLAPEFDAPAWPPGGRSWVEEPVSDAYAILQGCRLRLTRAEFIACPSCGRTQFDLQQVTQIIRARTSHLKGVKIAIMGCIVNGPGEMADADFGYVGSGPGKVDLYFGKERVRAGLPAAEAPDRLVELIRAHGRWADPPA